MLQNIIESIKGDRKLTFNHWRYRLLHWFFGVNPVHPELSTLPPMFYTHYCPLFHLTNLIALFSPFIFLFKVIWAVGTILVDVSIRIFDVTTTVSGKVARSLPKRAHVKKEPSPEQLREQELCRVPMAMKCFAKEKYGELTPENFSFFWFKYGDEFQHCTSSDVHEKYMQLSEKFMLAAKNAELRRQRIRNKMVFWVNFSQVFVKGLLNIGYLLLGVTVAYSTVFFLIPFTIIAAGELYQVLKIALNVDWIAILWDMAYWTMNFAVLCFIVVLAYRLIKWSKTTVFVRLGNVLYPPWEATCEWLDALGMFFVKQLNSVGEFVSIFYEENCPAIEIVSEEDALIASIEEEV